MTYPSVRQLDTSRRLAREQVAAATGLRSREGAARRRRRGRRFVVALVQPRATIAHAERT